MRGAETCVKQQQPWSIWGRTVIHVTLEIQTSRNVLKEIKEVENQLDIHTHCLNTSENVYSDTVFGKAPKDKKLRLVTICLQSSNILALWEVNAANLISQRIRFKRVVKPVIPKLWSQVWLEGLESPSYHPFHGNVIPNRYGTGAFRQKFYHHWKTQRIQWMQVFKPVFLKIG